MTRKEATELHNKLGSGFYDPVQLIMKAMNKEKKSTQFLGGDRTISRQRRYQLRCRENGLCQGCGRPTITMTLCRKHRRYLKAYRKKMSLNKKMGIDSRQNPYLYRRPKKELPFNGKSFTSEEFDKLFGYHETT